MGERVIGITVKPTLAGLGGRNDRMRGGKMRPGMIYGASDDRQPAGAAIGR